jgi:hypothetical protein
LLGLQEASCDQLLPCINPAGDCQSSGEAVLDYFGWANVLIWEWLLILLGMYFFYRGVFYASLLMSGTTR